MKLKNFLLLASMALLISACDYCPGPGQFAWTPYHCPPKPLKYPIPDVSVGAEYAPPPPAPAPAPVP